MDKACRTQATKAGWHELFFKSKRDTEDKEVKKP